MKRIYHLLIHQGLRAFMKVYGLLLAFAERIGPSKPPADIDGYTILLTGTFYSDNWLCSHLKPLSQSTRCREIRMVATSTVPAIEKVTAIYPPNWLVSLTGPIPARLLTFIAVAIRSRPHIVGGFHLLLNGLTAALIARVIGARSLYFCGGGRREVEGGGYATENRLFRMLALPDPVIERRLLDVVGTFDIIVTTGQKTIQFFEQHGIKGQFHIIPGGFDSSRFYPANHPPDADLILVGRLSSVKRVDVFLQAIRLARKEFPDISAIIVGDGPMGDPLKDLADELGVSSNVRFVGQQHRVEEWLRRAKIFVLTSDSEGLSLAMMEAMLSGLPPIVSEVGDLGEMVEDGVNGFLIHDRRPEVFADRILSLLREPNRLHRFSQSARRSVERFDVANVGRLWNDILQTDNLRDQCIITTPPATDRNKP